MQEWLKRKPIWFAILVGILNMELVVIPWMLKGLGGLSGWSLKFAAALWASTEIIFWYWFADWVINEIKKSKPIQEAIAIGKEGVPEVKDKESVIRRTDLVKKIEEWVNRYVIEPFNPENYKTKKVSLFIISCGYLLGLSVLFVFGLVPVLWIPGLVFCRVINSKTGLVAIVFGNMIKNFFFAESWDFIWSFL